VPVEAERAAAATVRRLGGWYKVDAENHVIEVNMVYHETPGRRYDNSIINTDEALRSVGSFPRLKELYLHKGQATDDGFKTLSKLGDLEVLFVWDAGTITDAGIAHLAGLKKLRNLHFNGGQLGGESLAVIARLPAIRQLSFQGNLVDDDALKHLANAKGLRTLWVGSSKRLITDAGARRLANLTSLEELELQGSDLTDAGVIAFNGLKQLRHLYVSSKAGAITDACVESLLDKPRLNTLWMTGSKLTDQRVDRLLGLKGLKELTLGISDISPERQEELKKRLPGLRMYP
jgi:hypothetical protein